MLNVQGKVEVGAVRCSCINLSERTCAQPMLGHMTQCGTFVPVVSLYFDPSMKTRILKHRTQIPAFSGREKIVRI